MRTHCTSTTKHRHQTGWPPCRAARPCPAHRLSHLTRRVPPAPQQRVARVLQAPRVRRQHLLRRLSLRLLPQKQAAKAVALALAQKQELVSAWLLPLLPSSWLSFSGFVKDVGETQSSSSRSFHKKQHRMRNLQRSRRCQYMGMKENLKWTQECTPHLLSSTMTRSRHMPLDSIDS